MVFWLVIGGIARGKRLYDGRRKDGKRIERVVIVINLLESYRRKCDDNNIYIMLILSLAKKMKGKERSLCAEVI